MNNHSDITWISRIISHPKAREPGEALMLPWIAVLVANMQFANAESTSWLAVLIPSGGFIATMAQRLLPTVWCILSQIAFACGFFAVIAREWILCLCNSCWKLYPVNSPPWSWIQFKGRGYRLNQQFSNCLATWAEVLFSSLCSSTSPVTLSMAVKAVNCTFWLLMDNVHGPMRSTATSLQGCAWASRGAVCPCPQRTCFCLWQVSHWLMLYCLLEVWMKQM